MKHAKKQTKQLTQAEIRKKIEKSGVDSAQEYEMIISNLQQQSLRLMNDRQQLKIRVDILLEKQKQLLEQQSTKGKKGPTVDYARLKRQLEDKYKEFEAWQKRCYNSINKGALNLQVKDYMNQCAVVEAEIVKYRKMLIDEKKQHRKLQKSVKIELKHLNKNVPQREVLEEENKQLRRMIWNLRVVEDLTGHVEVRLHNSIVGLQNKKKFIEKLKTMTVEEIRREEAKSKIEIINQQLKQKKIRHDSLRRLKTESRISMQKMSFQSEREKQTEKQLQKKIQEKEKTLKEQQEQKSKLQRQLKDLQDERTKLKEQQNSLNSILSSQEARISQKLQQIEPQMVDICLQFHSFQDQNPLPREIIGNQSGLLQDDRIVLKTSKDSVITGLVVYENNYGIACLRALYSNGKQTLCLPPQNYLTQKCKHKKIILHDSKDYLKWIKAYYDVNEKKLVRLEIYSNNKIKFQIGKQKDLLLKSVIPYKFDNSVSQIPVCMRVSYAMIDESWVVCSMGFQINSK